ncbi:MAG: hypothetical protein ACE15C_14860, partial [Phycisphaerae bacterium]
TYDQRSLTRGRFPRTTSYTLLARPHLKDFTGGFEPQFDSVFPSTGIHDMGWQDGVAPHAEDFLARAQKFVIDQGLFWPEDGTPEAVTLEIWRSQIEEAIELAERYHAKASRTMRSMLAQVDRAKAGGAAVPPSAKEMPGPSPGGPVADRAAGDEKPAVAELAAVGVGAAADDETSEPDHDGDNGDEGSDSAGEPKRKRRKRSERAACIEAIRKELTEHIRSARDHAMFLIDQDKAPELLPRPLQKDLATLVGVDEATVSRCFADPAAPELKMLYKVAGDLQLTMKYGKK